MAKKKKPEEHENLERWLVSYADFMTLLFATFVVLYALAQTDVSELSKIDESLQKAFSKMSILQGADAMLDGSQNIFDSQNGNSFIQELMTEYISPKYESQSFEQIEKSIEELKEDGELQGVDAKTTDDGLLITFDERYLFAPGSADLSVNSQKMLDKVGVLIYEKFVMHCIRVEGHTDSSPISSAKFPSNWELSSARACTIVRYLIGRFNFLPNLFTAVGYADTRPASKKDKKAPSRDRRVEIIILKNKYTGRDRITSSILKMNKEQQMVLQNKRKAIVSQVKQESKMSQAAEALVKNDKKRVIDMRNYADSRGINLENKEIYRSIEKSKSLKQKVDINKQLPDSEDIE